MIIEVGHRACFPVIPLELDYIRERSYELGLFLFSIFHYLVFSSRWFRFKRKVTSSYPIRVQVTIDIEPLLCYPNFYLKWIWLDFYLVAPPPPESCLWAINHGTNRGEGGAGRRCTAPPPPKKKSPCKNGQNLKHAARIFFYALFYLLLLLLLYFFFGGGGWGLSQCFNSMTSQSSVSLP